MIDVIIPVYRGLAATRRCVDSVLASVQRTPFEIVAIDDAGPEPAIAAYLDELAQLGRITLLRNDSNQGFVRTANRGMALHRDRDVVLLNSDTEVANDWLDRMHAAAERTSDVGTATPFSNNATICSYPFEGWSGGVPGTLGLAALDRLFATANAARIVELPTAIGFCMYIRRACLERVGPFDAERFGRGYGEENDFSLRAAKAGWRNVIAGDVFVFHEGSVSFSDEHAGLRETAERTLGALHPDYRSKVREFSAADPLSGLREAVDAARIATGALEERRVLAERADERRFLKSRLDQASRESAEHERVIAGLNVGLAHAEALIGERDAAIAELRGGLAHAEALAFERARELERLHRSWLWRSMLTLSRIRERRRRQRTA